MTSLSSFLKGAVTCTLFFLTIQTHAANFYWLASHYDNNWFDGRNWSHTPGGAAIGNSCACAGTDFPGSGDDVFIDASIGGQISFSGLAIQMKSMTWYGTATSTTELYGYGAMTVFGSLVFVSSMKVNISYLTLYGSGGTDVFTTAGNDMKDCVVAIGSGTYGLTGDYTSSTTAGQISLGGTFSTNNYNISVNTIAVSNSSAVTFNMGSSVITVVTFNMNYTPGSQSLTINPGTSTINFTDFFYGASKTYYSIVKTGNTGIRDWLLGNNTFTNMTIEPGVNCLLSGGAANTITGNLTVVGTAASRITLGNYGSGSFTLIAPNGSAMAYVDITNGIANNTGTTHEFTTTNSTKTNCHGWDRAATAITFSSVSKNYGAGSFLMSASSASTGAFAYSITSGNSFATINSSTGAVSITGAGSVTIKASQAGDLDYLPNSATATLTIAKAPLTITANNKTRLYGAANPTFDFSYSGFVNNETSSVLTSLPTATTSATTASGVNTYPIVATGGSADNYTLSYVNGTLSVTPAPIVVTVNDATRTYGASNPTFSYSYSGFVNGDDASAFQLPFSSPTTAATSGSAVGTYAINAVGGNVGPNYSVAVAGGAVNAGKLTITKAVLTITSNNQTRVYGAADPTFTFTYSGFVNGENASVLTSFPSVAPASDVNSPVGSYPINLVTPPTAPNYTFNYVNGQLTITKAPLTVIANDKTKIYGAANPTFDFSYSGFVNNETSSVLTSLPTATTSATTASGVNTYPIVAAGGSADNYTLSYVNGTLSVTPAPIVVTVNDATRTYGAPNPTFSYSYSGFVNGDDASAFQLPFSSPTTTATSGSAVGTYVISANGGNVGPNYSVNIGGYTVYDGTLTVSKASLTVTANDKSRIYGEANPSFDVNFSGFVNSDNVSVLASLPTVSTSANILSGVGTYAIVPTGGTATNYSLNYVNGSLSVTPAPLTVIANDASRVYGTENPSFTFSYSGFVNGDTESVMKVQPTAATVATIQSNTGTYPIIPSGGAANNYTCTNFQAGTLTITKADQTIMFKTLAPTTLDVGSIDLTATSSSGLPISYTSSDLSVATINGTTMTIVGKGTADITATQTGNNNFNAATPVTQTQVVKTPQTITFSSLPAKLITDAPFDLSATSSSGLAVTFTSADTTVATISGNTVTIVGAGNVAVTAHQPGDATYFAANDVSQTLVISKLTQTISFFTVG